MNSNKRSGKTPEIPPKVLSSLVDWVYVLSIGAAVYVAALFVVIQFHLSFAWMWAGAVIALIVVLFMKRNSNNKPKTTKE